MALVLLDRVREVSTTTGTGTITLGGAAYGYQSFAAIGNGNSTYYAIFDIGSGDWEVGIGTYTLSGTTLSRDTVLSSSNGGALVPFGAGTKDVFCTYPAEKAIYEEPSGNVLINAGPITVVGAGASGYTSFAAALAEMYANVDSFAQMYAQNLNGGPDASTDIVAYNNLGDGTDYFVDMGIASSNYTSALYPIFGPNDAYVYTRAAAAVANRLLIGTESPDADIVLFTGGVDTVNTAVTVSGTDQSVALTSDLSVAGTASITGAVDFGSTVLLSQDPTIALQAATKQYVDSAVSTGFVVHPAVRLATVAALPANTYNNGTAGVGATLTANANGALSIDGVAAATSDRVLIINEAAAANNGAYDVTATGSVGTPYVLTRVTDFDTATAGEIANNAYFFIEQGVVHAGSAFILSQTAAITVGTTALPFTQFSDQLNYVGGTNIDVSGLTISLTGTVAPTNGGTGVNTVTTGDLLYGTATNTWSKLPVGAAYKSLIVNAGGTQVEWNAVPLNQSAAVSGALGPVNGGTGQSSYVIGDLLYSSATNTLTKLPGNITTTKKYLAQTGTGAVSDAPVWDAIVAADISGLAPSATIDTTNAANITSGTLPSGRLIGGYTGITAVGTLIAGTWNASVIDITYGGTGASTVAQAQTNLQVDPAGTAIAMAIALG